MEFLPDGFESLKSEKKYWKMSQMKEGENRLRIVMKPIAGWVDWKENKPIRFKPECRPKQSVDPLKPVRAFWDMYVWDYAREDLFVLEVTQNTIIKCLMSLATDPDWGDFRNYDIKIKKEGTGKDTTYNVTAVPHKPIGENILRALDACPVRLEALYEGKDPWNDLVPSPHVSLFISPKEVAEIESLVKHSPDIKAKLLKWLQIDKVESIPSEYLEKTMKAIHAHLEKQGAA